MAVPPTATEPDDGWSMPPIILRSVDLPLPDFPTIATKSPPRISRSIDRRAENIPAGVSYVLVMCFIEIIEFTGGPPLLAIPNGTVEAKVSIVERRERKTRRYRTERH